MPNFVFGGKGWSACRSVNALTLFSIYCLGFLFCVVPSYRCSGLVSAGARRHGSSQRTWKMLEDAGRRGWKTWGSLAKSPGRRDFDLKKKKSFFSFFNYEIHVFQAISRGFPTSSSNVFQRLPTSSMCVATNRVGAIPKHYVLPDATRAPVHKLVTLHAKWAHTTTSHGYSRWKIKSER